jgi:hypothetical protein
MEGQAPPVKHEFVAEENSSFDKGNSVSEEVIGKDNNTTKTLNVSSPLEE